MSDNPISDVFDLIRFDWLSHPIRKLQDHVDANATASLRGAGKGEWVSMPIKRFVIQREIIQSQLEMPYYGCANVYQNNAMCRPYLKLTHSGNVCSSQCMFCNLVYTVVA